MKSLNKKSIFVLVLFVFTKMFFASDKTAFQYYELGKKAQNEENWYEAGEYYIEALNKNPSYFEAWFSSAECSYQLSEFDLTLEQLDHAEKYAKDSTEINNLRGMTYIAMQKFSEARKIFEKNLLKKPNDVTSRFGLAELDLFEGRVSGAEKQYSEALKRDIKNRKALLSLAVVSSQLGKFDNAKKYISQALSFYANEAEVHYIASIVAAMNDDIKNAELHAKVALQVDGNFEKAYQFLAKIYYQKQQYEDAVSLCDFIIGRNRNDVLAWYLKGQALYAQNKYEEAISVWSTGLNIFPEDEIMRTSMELALSKIVPLEDSRRKDWALYHVKMAKEYAKRYDSQGSSYEYQRALKIDPSNQEARMAFADILELNGMHELYLEQLLFVQNTKETSENNHSETVMNDKIEAYSNLLSDSLSKKWNVESFFLDKTRWSLGLYFIPESINTRHVENNRIACEFASDLFSGLASSSVKTSAESVSGFANAYKKAREGKKDYFILISFDEGERNVTLEYSMYSARTGVKILEQSVYGTGNNRYSKVFRRFSSDVLTHLPIRGKILSRDGKTLLSDLGRSENVIEGSVFDIVKKGSIQTSSTGGGVTYKDSDILGTFTVTYSSEEISEGLLEYRGFYDRVNTGDEIVLVSRPNTDEQNAQGTGENAASSGITDVQLNASPMADMNGQSVVKENKPGLTAEELGIQKNPAFIDLIRSIY